MRKQDGHRWTLAATALALTLALSGCGGGDTPEQLSLSLSNASETLPFAEVADTGCIATAIIDEVGFEQLQAEAVTSEALTLDPESVSSLLEAHRSDALDQAIESCIETDALFRAALAPMSPGGITCDDLFTHDTELVADYVTAHMESVDAELTIDDTPEMRDMFRPCLVEEDFAELFGIDTTAELTQAIDDNIGDAVHTAAKPCVGTALIKAFGSAELLNAEGITTEEPDFKIDELDLDNEEMDALLATLASCSDAADRLTDDLHTTEIVFGQCVVDTVRDDETWQEASVRTALGVSAASRTVDRVEDRALDDCVRDWAKEIYGPVDSIEFVQAEQWAIGGRESELEADPQADRYGNSIAEEQCVAVGIILEFDLSEFSVLETDPWSQAAYDLALKLRDVMTHGYRQCLGDRAWVLGDIIRAGFSDATLTCVESEIGDVSEFADDWEALLLDQDLTEDEYYREMEGILLLVEHAVETCYAEDEVEIYDDWVDWINTPYVDVDYNDADASVSA